MVKVNTLWVAESHDISDAMPDDDDHNIITLHLTKSNCDCAHVNASSSFEIKYVTTSPSYASFKNRYPIRNNR